MIFNFLIFLVFLIENAFIVYIFLKEISRLNNMLATKNNIKIEKETKNNVKYELDSVVLTEDIETKIEEKKKNKLLDELED